MQPQLPAFDARQVEQLLHQAGLRLRVALDDRHRVLDAMRRHLPARQHPRPAQHGVERRAQLVRDGREEVVLHADGVGQGRLGILLPRDVHGDAVKPRGPALPIVEPAAQRLEPPRAAFGQHDAEVDVAAGVAEDGALGALLESLAILGMNAADEDVEVDAGVGRQPEVRLALRVPVHLLRRQVAVPVPDPDGVHHLGESGVLVAQVLQLEALSPLAVGQRGHHRADDRKHQQPHEHAGRRVGRRQLLDLRQQHGADHGEAGGEQPHPQPADPRAQQRRQQQKREQGSAARAQPGS